MKLKKLVIVALLGLIVTTSCKKSDPIVPDEQEVLTTVIYTLTPQGGGDPVVFKWFQKDPDAGKAPVITNDSLKINTTYDGVLTLLNETETPAGDTTKEIQDDSLNHQFFFTKIPGLTISYADKDANGHPIGLKTTVVTTAAYKGGKMEIVLRHQPNKFGKNVSSGDITNAGGEIDADVTYTFGLNAAK